MSKWRKITIGDLGKIVTGKTPSTKNENFWNGDIPFVTPSDLQKSKHVFFTERTVSQEGLTAVRGQVLSSGAICVSCIGNLGYTAMTTQVSVSNQQINSIIPSDDFDKNFIYYLMKSLWDEFKNLEGQSTTLSILNKTLFSKMEVIVPEVNTQKQIAKVLSSLDGKIELNTQINHNLEEQAKAIFREYFQPHEKVVPLGSICKCVLGGTPNRNKSEFWGGDIPWINSGKVNEFRITTASEYITDSGLKNSSTKLLPCHTTVIAITGATLGQVSLLEIASCANQSVVGVLQNDNVPYTFIYPFIKENILELISNQTGGAQQHINKQNVEALPVPCYSPDLISEYHEKISPLYGQISNNCFESERLTGLRDLLLPKLMSGEIDVSEVEI